MVVWAALRRFGRHGCIDMAAALTFWAVLALFPGLVVVASILGLVGQSRQGTDALLGIARDLVPGAADQIAQVLGEVSTSRALGSGLVIGIVAALWSASRYLGAFSRSLNRIDEVPEERPYWRLKPQQLVMTLVVVLLTVLVALGLVVTGPIAASVGRALHIGDTAVTVWNVAKWPVLLAIVVAVVAILYDTAPDERRRRLRRVSIGAAAAVLLWIAASAGFAVYVTQIRHYDRTYGTLGGVVVFLLWLWITNLALLLGAEIDAELDRRRAVQPDPELS